MRKLLDSETLSISWRATGYVAPRKALADLQILERTN
jgi:hypothetical protein